MELGTHCSCLYGKIFLQTVRRTSAEPTVAGRVMVPKEAHVPVLGHCKYTTSHGKGNELKLQMKLMLLVRCSENREIILDYLGGPSV